MLHSAPRLLTLGRCELVIETSAGPRSVPTQAQRLAFLAYLAAALPGEDRALNTLLPRLWPEHSQRGARRALQQTLHHLRRQLGEEIFTISADDQVGITLSLVCDALEFERAVRERRFADAVALYGGPFLGNLHMPHVSKEFVDWKQRTHLRLHSAATHSAWQLAMEAESRGDDAAAANAAFYAHELEPANETGLQRLLELLHRQRDRAGALRAYQDFADKLKLERGLEPAAETAALLASIRPAPRGPSRAPVRSLTPEQQRTFDSVIHAPAPAVLDLSVPDFEPAARVFVPHPPRDRGRRVAQAVLTMVIIGPVSYAIAASRPFLQPAGARAAVLQPHDQVLVSDFNSQSRDSTLGIALAEALRAGLSLSPRVRVLTTTQTRALNAHRKPLQRSVADSLLRVRAVREGVKAFVTGEVSSLGAAFVISTRLVAAPSGAVLAAARATARDSTQLLAAIDRVSARLRKRMGEALPQIEAEPSLQTVTTASWPALRKFSQALYLTDVLGDRPGAIRLLEEALALDSSFAAAHCRLGVLYADVGEPARAAQALERAFALRDRLPLRERYLTMGGYYHVVTREYERAASAYRSLLEENPQDITGLTNLALVYVADRQFARAESFFRRVIAIDSTLAPAHLGRAEVLINESQFDSARSVLDYVWKHFPDYGETRLTEAYLAAARQDWPGTERHLRLQLAVSRGRPFEEVNALQTLGQTALIRGRLAEAQQYLNAALVLADSSQSPGRYLSQTILLGWLELRYQRQTASALARIDTALTRFPLATLDPADRPYLEMAAFYAAANQPARAIALLSEAERDSAAAPALRGAGWHHMRGLVALAENRGPDAIAEFQQVDSLDHCAICVLPNLAAAYQISGDSLAAIATYERYLATPWIRRFEGDALYLSWSLRQLGQLYESQRQRARAADQYTRLARLWVSADAQLKAEAHPKAPVKRVVKPPPRKTAAAVVRNRAGDAGQRGRK